MHSCSSRKAPACNGDKGKSNKQIVRQQQGRLTMLHIKERHHSAAQSASGGTFGSPDKSRIASL
eukprot:1160599-Pelagomonas_calceolata.AAC.19